MPRIFLIVGARPNFMKMAPLYFALARTRNLMPTIVACVENDVTLGEVCNTLRGVFGEYQASAGI